MTTNNTLDKIGQYSLTGLKWGGAITTAIISPIIYAAHKWNQKEHYEVPGAYFGALVLNFALSTGIIGLDSVLTEEKKYEIGNHEIVVKGMTANEFSEKNSESTAFRIIKKVISPTSKIYDALVTPTHTVIDDKYEIEGEGVIQYTSEQGFILNENALKTRTFYYQGERYEQEKLVESIESKLLNYDKLEKEVNENSASGDFTQAMELTSEFLTELKQEKKKYAEIEDKRNRLILELKSVVNDMNEEAYNTRVELKKEIQDMKRNIN